MITFTYNKKIENNVFDDYVRTRKSPAVVELLQSELENVELSKETLSSVIEQTRHQWSNVENNFYKNLGAFYEKNLTAPNITCYLTRLDIFPYNFAEKWFTAPLFGNPAERNRVIMHELCHYFQPQELPDAVKEAVPVILNDHDVFQMYSRDRGHASDEEQKWRKIIWKIYTNGGTFSDILKKVDT